MAHGFNQTETGFHEPELKKNLGSSPTVRWLSDRPSQVANRRFRSSPRSGSCRLIDQKFHSSLIRTCFACQQVRHHRVSRLPGADKQLRRPPVRGSQLCRADAPVNRGPDDRLHECQVRLVYKKPSLDQLIGQHPRSRPRNTRQRSHTAEVGRIPENGRRPSQQTSRLQASDRADVA